MTPGPSEPGKVVAFYSFKGGTGRSMALANVACILAGNQPKGPVLMIDWDLEAPGLHRYFRKHLFSAFRGADDAQDKFPGVIDLFIELQRNLGNAQQSTPQDFQSASKMLRELHLDDYIIQTDIANLKLLKAGQFNHEYPARVGTFDWMNLYRRSPFLLRALAEQFAQQFQYILIDSRTGLTDTSGICAMLMPEVLVTVFTPNRQSLSGVVDLVREAARYRSQSDDIRPLIVYPLPSRIEASEPTLRKQWRFGDSKAGIEGFQAAFERTFKEVYALPVCGLGPYFDDVQIQHVPRYAYGEEIAVLGEETRDRFSLTRSYQRFAKRLQNADLPWADSLQSDDFSVDVRIPANVEDDKIKERAAAAYLQTLKEFQASSKRKARRLRATNIGLNAVGLALLTTVSIPDVADGPLFLRVTVVLLGATALLVAIVIGLGEEATSLEHVTRTLELEVSAFEEKVAPYDTEVALQRLKSRIETLQSLHPRLSTKSKTIYISYSRSDAAGQAGRLYDSLRSRGSNFEVFMDIDSITPGEDFVAALQKTVSSADVVLAVIGPDWIGTSDDSGNRQLDYPSDFVRVELSAALRKNARVIPVLVGGARMPSPAELPDDLMELSRRNALELNDRRWDADLLRLYEAIDHAGSLRS